MSENAKHIRVISTAQKAPKNPFKDDVLYTPEGQWKYPGQITKIPDRNITMKGVNYPVLGVDDLGNEQMMYPGANYTFPGNTVTEYPQLQYGGDPSISYINHQFQTGGWLDEMQQGGTMYTENPKDPRIKAYNDSLFLYNANKGMIDKLKNLESKGLVEGANNEWWNITDEWKTKYAQKQRDIQKTKFKKTGHIYEPIKDYETKNKQGYAEEYKKPIVPVKYKKPEPKLIEEPAKEVSQEQPKEVLKQDTTRRHVDFSSPYGPVMKYYDEAGNVIKTEPYVAQRQMGGGWLDELDMKKGGPLNPLMLSREKRRKTSKNIQSSINKIFLRNPDLFGPGGKNIYDPKAKYQGGGGWLDNLTEI